MLNGNLLRTSYNRIMSITLPFKYSQPGPETRLVFEKHVEIWYGQHGTDSYATKHAKNSWRWIEATLFLGGVFGYL